MAHPKNLAAWGLYSYPFPKQQILDSSERNCRRQFQVCYKQQEAFRMCRKPCWKRRNCSSPANSSFPTVFSKSLCCRHVNTRACLGKGKTDKRRISLLAITPFIKIFSHISLYLFHVDYWVSLL